MPWSRPCLRQQLAIEGFLGAAYALHHVAALHAMAELRDLGRAVGDGRGVLVGGGRGPMGGASSRPPRAVRRTWTGASSRPCSSTTTTRAGSGSPHPFTTPPRRLVAAALDLVTGCPCPAGCPACVGPVLPGDEDRPISPKAAATTVLSLLEGGRDGL